MSSRRTRTTGRPAPTHAAPGRPAPVFPATVVIDTREQQGYGFSTVPDDPPGPDDDATGDVPTPGPPESPYTFAAINADEAEGGGLLTVPTVVEGLPSGDYSLIGYTDRVSVERKSLADLFKTIGHERGRFIRELERLNEYTFAAVVVEAEWSTILTDPPRHTKLPPKTIRRSVVAWMQRFPRVHWDFLPGRDVAEVATFRHLDRFLKERERERQERERSG